MSAHSPNSLNRDAASGFIGPAQLRRLQEERLQEMLRAMMPANTFYRAKLEKAGFQPESIKTLDNLVRLPFTTKAELTKDQSSNPPYGRILTYQVERYCRMHQTSGTAGQPLRWLDTAESWRWVVGCWDSVYRICGLKTGDRLFFAFSFGPFLGFWSGFEAATRAGYLCVAGGGMSSTTRLRLILDNRCTVVLSTPTYALHLAEVARAEGIELAGSPVRALIVAGEPGGNIPSTRLQIESAWGARLFDHAGMTEIGPVGVECQERPGGLHLLETDYIAEVIDPLSGEALPLGEPGELVLTNLGRWGSPLLRYRTGDRVRVDPRPCSCGRSFAWLDGGILGRTDDMIHVRGNNLYPSSVEAVIRRFPEVVEFRVEVDHGGPLAELRIEVEPVLGGREVDLAERIGTAIRDELLFRAEVTTVPPGSLPRFEMKARRFIIKKPGQPRNASGCRQEKEKES
jgi:phenylacetate-CoA ligase